MADQTALHEAIAMMNYFMNARTKAGIHDWHAYTIYGEEYDKWLGIYQTLFDTIYRRY